MESILEGIRVIDFGLILAGPYACSLLGDMGAEVIKIEEPGVGDPYRGLSHMQGVPMIMPHGRNATFEDFNHSKKGIALNLKKPEGKEILYELVEKSDVFVTNYRQDALERMGLDYATLQKRNPRIIYALATFMGTRGPERGIPGMDMLAQARSGIMMNSGEEGTPPVLVPNGMVDRLTGMSVANGVVAALLVRERRGIGQMVHCSLLGTMFTAQGVSLGPSLMSGKNASPRTNRRKTRNPLYNYWQCKDGKWVTVPLWQYERYFPPLCEKLGIPELVQDPRFATEAVMVENGEALFDILEKAFMAKTAREWQGIMREVDILVAVVQEYEDLIQDPQLIANDYITTWDHPIEGPVKYMGFATEFSQTPLKISRAAPEVGEHTEEVLQNILGYDWERIGQLHEDGVF